MRNCLLFLIVLAGPMLGAQPLASEKPYKVGGSVSAPSVISKVEPEYTQEALNARREGSVLIEVVVTPAGEASDLHEISQPLEFGLDAKAIEALQQWRFKPGEKGGRPVPVIVQIRMNFRLPQ
jgi:protein TonB